MALAESTSIPPASTDSGIGGVVKKYLWIWEGQPLTVGYCWRTLTEITIYRLRQGIQLTEGKSVSYM